MKKSMLVSLATIAGIVFLSSCGGGWTEESKKTHKDSCTASNTGVYEEADVTSLCQCYLDQLVAKYPAADFTPDQGQLVLDTCAMAYQTIADKEAAAAAEAAAFESDTTQTTIEEPVAEGSDMK